MTVVRLRFFLRHCALCGRPYLYNRCPHCDHVCTVHDCPTCAVIFPRKESK